MNCMYSSIHFRKYGVKLTLHSPSTVLQTTGNNGESTSTKRSASGETGSLVKSKPNGLEMDWKGREFGITACVMAFSAKSTCKLAICPDCFVKRDDNLQTTLKKKRRRSTKDRNGETAAKSTGKKNVGVCGKHTSADIKNLTIMTDIKYLARRRKDTETGYANIATTCYDCGVSF